MHRCDVFDLQCTCRITSIFLSCLFLGLGTAFAAQEFNVGYIQGGGDGPALHQKAFENAKIEFKYIKKGNYKIDTLLKFDVIAVGEQAYHTNADLKDNFKVVNEYVEAGGYLVTVDFQQDSTWNKNYLPHPLTLLDPDLEDNVGVELADHDLFKKPNKLEADKHFGAGVWGNADFMADGPQKAPAPWIPLVTDKQNKWPMVVGAEAGKGYVILNSLQIIQALGRTGKQELSEVLHNFLFWRGQLAVKGKWKLATKWGKLKGQ